MGGSLSKKECEEQCSDWCPRQTLDSLVDMRSTQNSSGFHLLEMHGQAAILLLLSVLLNVVLLYCQFARNRCGPGLTGGPARVEGAGQAPPQALSTAVVPYRADSSRRVEMELQELQDQQFQLQRSLPHLARTYFEREQSRAARQSRRTATDLIGDGQDMP